MRTGPGTLYAILGQVHNGEYYCPSWATSGAWRRIYWRGVTAWVHGGYVVSVTLGASKVGLDINQPVDGEGNLNDNADADRIAATGTRWARVNVIGENLDGYDVLIDALVARGIQVYLLVGAQAVSWSAGELFRSYPGPDAGAANAWIQSYAERFVQVVDRYKDRVRVYETFNEPNDWAGGTTHIVHPRWMAKILQQLYLNTKHFNGHAGVAAWQVTIVSGPLFSFDLTTAADYLADVYWYGRNAEAWDWTRSETGSFPLDGIGYHMYVAQDTSQGGEIGWRMDAHLDAIWSVVTSNEGSATAKRAWISEFGFPSQSSEAYQASSLTTAFGALKSDARVAMACWFCQHDFSPEGWGLFREDWSVKPAWGAFNAVANN